MDQPDVLVQSLMRLSTQRLDVVQTAQTLQIWGGEEEERMKWLKFIVKK